MDISFVVVTNATCLTMSDRGPRNSPWLMARGIPIVSRSFQLHAGWLDSTSILKENTLTVVKGFPSLFPFYQPHERTCGLTAI
ncbi:hypothetical protein TNCV_567641 [Trichonephila clavipes]|nr:hypothetical protein TNCV_567641 [Trichonephila clavipes]